MVKMALSRVQVLWGITAVCLLALSFLVKFSSEGITTRLYNAQNTELLQLFVAPPEEGLDNSDYYVGEMEVGLFGPLAVTLAGAAFLIFALVFLRKASALTFGCAVFVYLLITKFEILFFPPYGDAIGGPLAEAIWLANHSFDYAELWRQPVYMQGGPKVYFFTIYPACAALLMKIMPTAQAFIVTSHLLTFALTGAIAALFRRTAAKAFSPGLATMTTVMFLSVPIALSMFEAINMEVPVLVWAMLSVAFLAEKKVVPASVFAVLAALTKGYAVLVCGAVACCCVMWFFMAGTMRERLKYGMCGVAVTVAAGFLVYMASLLTFQYTAERYTAVLSGWASLKGAWIFYFFVGFLLIYIKKLFDDVRRWKADREGFSAEACARQRVIFVMFTVMLMWFVLFLNHMTVSPRYSFILMPFIIFCGVYAVLSIIRNEKGVAVILGGAIFLSLINSYGLLYKPIGGYDYVLEERSLAYRNDARLTQRIAEEITQNFSGFTIGAPFIIGQTLAMPEYGYVREPLDVMMYGWPIRYGGIKLFKGLKHVDIRRTVWVGVRSGLPEAIPFPTDANDKILRRINVGHQKAVFFMGGFAIERVRRMIEGK